MRSIKFRIWDGNNEFFIYPEVLELNCGLEYQQYTGLKDKHGKEIYEGDILEWQKGMLGVVEYIPTRFIFKSKWLTPMGNDRLDTFEGVCEM